MGILEGRSWREEDVQGILGFLDDSMWIQKWHKSYKGSTEERTKETESERSCIPPGHEGGLDSRNSSVNTDSSSSHHSSSRYTRQNTKVQVSSICIFFFARSLTGDSLKKRVL